MLSLRQAEESTAVGEVYRKAEISDATFIGATIRWSLAIGDEMAASVTLCSPRLIWNRAGMTFREIILPPERFQRLAVGNSLAAISPAWSKSKPKVVICCMERHPFM